MIERLYGVEHSVMFSCFFSTEEKSVCPSEELVGKLSALPAGTVVGIEFSLEANLSSGSLNDKVRLNDGSEIMISPAFKYYWRRLIDVCGCHNLG